jgi:hypothetical protein
MRTGVFDEDQIMQKSTSRKDISSLVSTLYVVKLNDQLLR